MKHYKKIILTLALLLTAVTGAWAESKPIGLNVEYAVGDVITSTTDVYVYYGEHPTNHKQMAVKITSTQPLTISMIDAYSIGFNGNDAVYYLPDGDATGGSAGVIPCVGESTGDATVVHVASGTGTLTDPYVFGSGPFGTPVPLTRGTGEKINEWTLTNGMPAGNVTVSVEYFPQAALTAAPTAINDVPATTDGAIVKAGTVANIGSSTTPQGTVMYYAVQSATPPTAPDYDATGWTDKVPTATDFAEGNVYVWYYIKGAEPASGTDRTDANTCSDSEITALGTTGYVTIAAEPTYAVTFVEGTDPNEWTAAPNADVKKGTEVTVTYTGTKKVIGVKVEKKSPIITWDNTNVFVKANQGKNVDKWNTSATFKGITISFNGKGTASHFYPYDTMGADLDVLDYGDSFTFTAPTGKMFAKIEINGSFSNLNDANWSTQANGIVWSNTPSNTVTIATTENYTTDFNYITSIVFTLSE